MTTRTHPLVTAWLDRLDVLSRGLPAPHRDELRTELREHLDRSMGERPSDEQVRATLARMGDPVDIVAAAMEDQPSATPPPPPTPPVGPAPSPAAAPASTGPSGAEVVTLALLVAAGLLLPLWPLAVLSWIVALVLLVTRDRWQGVENVVALLVPIGFALPWVAGLAAFQTAAPCSASGTVSDTGQLVESAVECSGGGVTVVGVLATVLLVVGVLGAAFAVLWLARRLRAPLAEA